MRADCGSWECDVDFADLKETPPGVTITYIESLDELNRTIKDDMVWPPKVARFLRWLRNYKVIRDLGYVIVRRNGRIERILAINMFYSVWLKRPALKVVDISSFGVEPGEIKDD
jgi:hypothetical protein